MEWLTSIRKAIDFMETHLKEDISVQDVADAVFISPFFLQKGFSVMTGYGIGEYIRNRRLYQAALDLRCANEKIIDIAYDYAYETPESFTKAFTRFHGATPSQIRSNEAPIRRFLPLKINISIQGGFQMDYKIKTLSGFKVIGFERAFTYEEAKNEIPKYWDEVMQNYLGKTDVPMGKAIEDNGIGEYGICIDDPENGTLRYLIAGGYKGGEVPEGMTLFEFPKGEWAMFDCYGPIPAALQSLSDKIFKEWLPGNPEFELAQGANVEWYDGSNPDLKSDSYHSAVWIPVKHR